MLRVSRKPHQVRCVYCRDAIPWGEGVPCDGCETVLHADCWTELTSCPTPGCEEALPDGVKRQGMCFHCYAVTIFPTGEVGICDACREGARAHAPASSNPPAGLEPGEGICSRCHTYPVVSDGVCGQCTEPTPETEFRFRLFGSEWNLVGVLFVLFVFTWVSMAILAFFLALHRISSGEPS